jgi:hypothetical protein
MLTLFFLLAVFSRWPRNLNIFPFRWFVFFTLSDRSVTTLLRYCVDR